MAANEKTHSKRGILILILTVLPVVALFLDLWDTQSYMTLDYVLNALDKPHYVVSVCLIMMAASAILGPIFTVIGLKNPKAMAATATVSAVGSLSVVTYFAVYGEAFTDMLQWMGTGAFVYFAGSFAVFMLSLIAAFGNKAEPAAAKPAEKPVMPMPEFGAPSKPREEAQKPEFDAPAKPAPAPAPVAPPAPAPVAPPTPTPVAPAAPAPVAPPAPAPAPEPSAAEICGNCGGKLVAGMRFCPGCGSPAAPAAPAPVAPPAPAPVAPPTPAPSAKVYCPTCRVELAPGTRQCRFCGNTVHAVAVPGVSAERRSTVISAAGSGASADKNARKAVCPHCGARQLPGTHCKYCGTPMG